MHARLLPRSKLPPVSIRELGSFGDQLAAGRSLRHDDARFFALEFGCGRELAAQEFDVATSARASVRAQQSHAKQKNEKRENFGVFYRRRACAFSGLLLRFIQELRKSRVQFAG
jgi:hypothetical protein